VKQKIYLFLLHFNYLLSKVSELKDSDCNKEFSFQIFTCADRFVSSIKKIESLKFLVKWVLRVQQTHMAQVQPKLLN